MPNGNQRWSVPTYRFGTSVILAICGTFVLCGSVGMDNLTVGAIGLALLAGAVGLYAISALNSRTFAFIPGTAHVVSASEPPASASRGRCNLHVLVTARNMDSIAVKIRDPQVPVAKWPDAGSDLPILVAVGDPRRVRVLWDEIVAHGAPRVATVRSRRGEAQDIVDLLETNLGEYETVDMPVESTFDEADLDEADLAELLRDNTSVNEGIAVDDADLVDEELDDGSVLEGSVVDGSGVDGSGVEDLGAEDLGAEDLGAEDHIDGDHIDGDLADDGTIRESLDRDDLVDVGAVGIGIVDEDLADGAPAFGAGEAELDDLGDDDEILAVGVVEANGRRTIELDVRDPNLVRWSSDMPAEATPTADMPAEATPTADIPALDIPVVDAPAVYTPVTTAAPAAQMPDQRVNEDVAAGAVPVDIPVPRLPRRTPSPRPRMGPERPMAPTSATGALIPDVVGLSFAEPQDDPAVTLPGTLVNDHVTAPLQFDQARVVSPGVTAAPDAADGVYDQATDEATIVADAYLAAAPPPGANAGGGPIRSVAVTLFVTDLSRSIVFYRDVLGFTETDAGRGSAVLVSGDARIVLRRVAMPPVDRRLVQLLLEVPDVLTAYDDLRTRGVSFIHRPRPVGQYEQSELWSAAFRDPDGHGIAITQWRSLT